MKFIVKNLTKCAPRIGKLEDIKRLPNLSLETPMAMLYTQGGSIPHMTREVLNLVTNDPHTIQVPVTNTTKFREPMSNFNGTIAEFVGLKEYIMYVMVQDPGIITPNGHHLQNNVAIWARDGKLYIDPNSYMDVIDSFKPDMYCFLCDGDTNNSSSKKRISKSVDQTILFFNQCLDRHYTSKKLKDSMVIAPIEGGYCLHSRQRCIDGIVGKIKDIGGFLIDGLHNNGPEVELLSFDDIKSVVEKIICLMPEDKMRIIHGCWNPFVVLKLVSLGIDVFDTSYLCVVTERSAALTFNYDPITEASPQREYEINFRNTKYATDFSPIVEGCECLSCKRYSRSYIHHLTSIQELLGPILLQIHNIHHYLEYFKRIRKAVKNETLEQLEMLIKTQYDEYQKMSNEKQFNHVA